MPGVRHSPVKLFCQRMHFGQFDGQRHDLVWKQPFHRPGNARKLGITLGVVLRAIQLRQKEMCCPCMLRVHQQIGIKVPKPLDLNLSHSGQRTRQTLFCGRLSMSGHLSEVRAQCGGRGGQSGGRGGRRAG